MARKRRTRKKGTHRRRIGAAGGTKDFLMEAAGTSLTLAYGGKLVSMVPTSVDPKIVGLGEGVIGYFIARKTKNPLLRGAAIGFVAMGVSTLLKAVGIAGAPGLGYKGPVDFRRVAGPGGYPALQTVGDAAHDMMAGFTPEMNTISGMEEYEEEEYLD